MRIFSLLALILLAWFGYAVGNTLAGRNRPTLPGVFDFWLSLLIAIAAIFTRNLWDRWLAIIIWIGIGIMIGGIVGAIREDKATINTVENSHKTVWQKWKAFALKLGDFQGRIVLLWLYYIVVSPFGLITRLTNDPLKIKQKGEKSAWLPLTKSDTSLDKARKQF